MRIAPHVAIQDQPGEPVAAQAEGQRANQDQAAERHAESHERHFLADALPAGQVDRDEGRHRQAALKEEDPPRVCVVESFPDQICPRIRPGGDLLSSLPSDPESKLVLDSFLN